MARALAVVALLSACAAEPPAEAPPPAPAPAAAPEIVVNLSRTGGEARMLMHLLAAECWLDGIVRGAQLIVRPDGSLVIVGETSDLLAAEAVGLKALASRWKLTGDAIADPEMARLVVRSIDRANATGETACDGPSG